MRLAVGIACLYLTVLTKGLLLGWAIYEEPDTRLWLDDTGTSYVVCHSPHQADVYPLDNCVLIPKDTP